MSPVGPSRNHPEKDRRGEIRLPAVISLLIAIGLYAALPSRLVLVPRLVVPAVELVLLVSVTAVNPWRLSRETRVFRVLSLGMVAVIALANLLALCLLVHALLESKVDDGKQLLVAAFQVWTTNIIVFGLAYWELDRGGPVSRAHEPRDRLAPADFRFSQDETADAIVEVAVGSSEHADWVPGFVDYLYVSITNSTAFSPTDTMPLTTRAKILMSVQSVSALIVSILVIARAVGNLK